MDGIGITVCLVLLSLMRSSDESRNSFLKEVLLELKIPLAKVFFLWSLLSAVVILLDVTFSIAAYTAAFIGSMLSVIGTSLILFSASQADDQEKQAFQFIFFLTICDFLFAVKMILSASWVFAGRSLDWQDRHDGWCYFSALLGQFSAMGSMGWSFIIVLDLLFIVFRPLQYSRNRKTYFPLYHAVVWGIAIMSCIPAVATGHVGMSSDKTCWFLGSYVWSFWAVWYFFVVFAVSAAVALFVELKAYHEKTSTISSAYVSVVRQSTLITFTFFLCWFWNGLFRMFLFAGGEPPKWLIPVQIFWLGGLGFGNSIIWLPFIEKAIKMAKTKIIMKGTAASTSVTRISMISSPSMSIISTERGSSASQPPTAAEYGQSRIATSSFGVRDTDDIIVGSPMMNEATIGRVSNRDHI